MTHFPASANHRLLALLASAIVCAAVAPPQVQAQRSVGEIQPIEFSRLTDTAVSPLGRAALAIRPGEWKHSETKNFVYHYFNGFVATPVSVEAEYYYEVIAKELRKDTARWERKSHIFIFEAADDWAAFQKAGNLDPWTGGIHSGGELFIQRDPAFKWKGSTLGHEVAHLVVHRFMGNGVPLWLNEGYAEYVSGRAYANFYRARGYDAKPRSQAVPPERFIPLAQLASAISYPADPLQVPVFYNESERLTRFLSAAGEQNFLTLFDELAKGARLESAVQRAYGSRFSSLDSLEQEFRVFATKDHVPAK